MSALLAQRCTKFYIYTSRGKVSQKAPMVNQMAPMMSSEVSPYVHSEQDLCQEEEEGISTE